MVEVSNPNLGKEITNVHGSKTEEGDMKCNGDEALQGLQV